MIQTNVITPLRQRLQNCGSSLSASDFKALLDALELLEKNINVGALGIINVNNDNNINGYFNTPNDARSLVSVDNRIPGQIISYRLATGWVLEMFNGDHNQVWLEDGQWKQYITKDVLDQVNVSLNDLWMAISSLYNNIAFINDDIQVLQQIHNDDMQFIQGSIQVINDDIQALKKKVFG